jgi:hypothetical protein
MLPECLLCHVEVDNLDHPAAPVVTGGAVEYACSTCFSRLMEMVGKPERAVDLMRCDGCGAAWGAGCSCKRNARAIGRGERLKCESEEL